MSDFEDDYDFFDDDFFFYDDDQQDQLAQDAERAQPSPVLIGYEPSMDPSRADVSDWEYYSDDYYDDLGQKEEWKPASDQLPKDSSKGKGTIKRKRKVSGTTPSSSKRAKLSETSNVPSLSLDDSSDVGSVKQPSPSPIIRWRRRDKAKSKRLTQEEAKRAVAILPGWRELFAVPQQDVPEEPRTNVKKTPLTSLEQEKVNPKKRKTSMSPPSEPVRRSTRRRKGK